MALLVLLLAGSSIGFAQPDEARIVEIEIRGLRTLAAETVRFYLGLEEGEALDERGLSRNIHRLWGTQLIDDIVVEREPVPGGVRLVVSVEERPALRSVEYVGLRRVTRTEVAEKITKERIRVREGDPLVVGEVQRLKHAIEQLYQDKGYRFADVSFEIETLSPGERRVRFMIDEGDRVRIGGIEFQGNTVFGDHRLRWAMRQTKVTAFVPQLLQWDIFNPAKLQEDLARLRHLYREAGYKNAVVGEPITEIRVVDPKVPMSSGPERRLFITIPIEENERWRLGEIRIRGAEVFPEDRLRQAFQRPRGGWLRASAIEDGVEAIAETYRNSGYIYSRVDTEVRERMGGGDENVADLVVNIVENEQFRVGRIEFQGNNRTRDRVLRRELRVHEGFVLNMGALRNSMFKINQLGYFKLDEDDPVQFNVDTEERTVDLVVQGEEADRTELMLGGGWSELDGVFGQFSVRTQNFLGRGESAGASYQSGRFRTSFSLSYQIPWFRDRPQSIGIQLFRMEDDFPFPAVELQQFTSKQQGGRFTYGRSLGLFQTASLTYSRFSVEQAFRIATLEGELSVQQVSFNTSSLRPMYTFDSRDSGFEPTRGLRFFTSVEYAGGFLGGTNFFVRPETGASYYRPVTTGTVATVVALHGEAGWVRPFGGSELFLFDRYILGGEQSIRGHRWRSVWPRGPDDELVTDEAGNLVGGNKFIQTNLEYHFLLGGPFRLLGFVDAANVYAEGQSVDLSGLRYTAGLELRVNVPMFGAPLRFIYSFNLNPLPGDRFENFQFSIGSTF